MQTKVTFSILCPVYNVEKFLVRCIESVLKQTFTDWELILVDDGSIDNSGKICDEYKSKYPIKIKVFHNQNMGQFYSRNFAISKASGNYYIFVDADDKIVSNTLEIIYDKFNQYKCDCIIYGMVYMPLEGKLLYITEDKEFFCNDKRSLYRKILLNHSYNSLCRKAIKSSIVKNSSGYYNWICDIRYGEDLLKSLDILHNCTNCLFIPQVLYCYIQNPKSIVNRPSLLSISNFFELRQYVLDFIIKEKIFIQQDFEDLHSYYLTLFENVIKYICHIPLSLSKKIKLMKEIKKERFYQKFIISSQYKQQFKFIYTQFRLSLYRLLIFEIKIYSFIKSFNICHKNIYNKK